MKTGAASRRTRGFGDGGGFPERPKIQRPECNASYVRARVHNHLKQDSGLILRKLGLTTTEAIRIFLHQVRRHKGLPFRLRLREDNSDILLPVAMRQSALDSVYAD